MTFWLVFGPKPKPKISTVSFPALSAWYRKIRMQNAHKTISTSDVPQMTRSSKYSVDVSWRYLGSQLLHYITEYQLDLNPNFQRAHVWSHDKKVRYIEYIMRGGMSGRDIYINAPGWSTSVVQDWMVLVDGKQRLEAVISFLSDEFRVFHGLNGNPMGYLASDFEGGMDIVRHSFRFHINDLATIEECYQWYIDINAGGVAHTEDEIEKVKGFLTRGEQYEHPSEATLAESLNRSLFNEAKAKAAEEAKRREEMLAQVKPTTRKRKK